MTQVLSFVKKFLPYFIQHAGEWQIAARGIGAVCGLLPTGPLFTLSCKTRHTQEELALSFASFWMGAPAANAPAAQHLRWPIDDCYSSAVETFYNFSRPLYLGIINDNRRAAWRHGTCRIGRRSFFFLRCFFFFFLKSTSRLVPKRPILFGRLSLNVLCSLRRRVNERSFLSTALRVNSVMEQTSGRENYFLFLNGDQS